MLTPDYLDHLPAPVQQLWQQVEDDILRDVARRIGKMDGLTATTDWQLWRREQTRLANREVRKILARYSGKSEDELRRIFEQAAAKALEDDDLLYRSAGLDPPEPNEDPALLNLLNAGYEQTAGSWHNLTATTANTVTRQFEGALDRAWLQVSTGAFDYQTAIRRAVNGLADSMAGVTYPTGHRDTLEVAVRRCVLTGVNQTAGKLQIARMDQMGWQFVETSAHQGARPAHAAWQGRQYHRGGAVTYKGRRYPDFEKATGYGTGAGLCGWNCRHTFFAFDPDLSEPAYTEAELAALDAKDIEYQGKLYSRYEINQQQRALERRVRKYKRRCLAGDAAGLDTTQSAVKLRQARQELAQFVRDTGGRNDSERTFVAGFGRSEAARATAQAKKAAGASAFTNAGKGSILDKTNPDNGGSVKNIEINLLGKIDPKPLRDVFGPLQTTDVVVTNERIAHIKERHPQDYELFEKYGAETVAAPDMILQDTKHTGTVFMVRHLPDTNLNVIVRLAIETDASGLKNSVMTFYRIRDKNLRKLEEKSPLLYKRE